MKEGAGGKGRKTHRLAEGLKDAERERDAEAKEGEAKGTWNRD